MSDNPYAAPQSVEKREPKRWWTKKNLQSFAIACPLLILSVVIWIMSYSMYTAAGKWQLRLIAIATLPVWLFIDRLDREHSDECD